MLSKWIPLQERGAAMSIVDTGTSVASMLTFSLSPVLAQHFGWQFAFRCFAYVSLAICGLWAVFASNTPRDCPYVTDEERKYLVSSGMAASEVYGKLIESPPVKAVSTTTVASATTAGLDGSSLGSVGKRGGGSVDRSSVDRVIEDASCSALAGSGSAHGKVAKNGDDVLNNAAVALPRVEKQRHRFPVHLFGHAAAWATIWAHTAFNFGRYFVYNQLVTYYVEVVGTTVVVAGQQMFLGQIADTVGKFGFAPFVDAAIRRNPGSKTRVRKTVSGTAFVGFAVSMLIIASSSSLPVVTGALVVCKIASSAHVCGFKTSFLDLTSKHTGTLAGVSNTLATLSAMLSPIIAGKLLVVGPDGWVHTFVIIAAINVAACLVWVSFSSAESLDDKFAAAKTTL